MESPVNPPNEKQRHLALCALDILDTSPEEGFDRLTRICQSRFDVPICLVSLVDSERQWFKSRQGLDAPETPRDISFCGHAILGEEIFCISNTLEDPRFADNPLVTGPPDIRFYAGAPISTADGMKVGTLCIIDTVPRTLSLEDKKILRDLADTVQQELEQKHLRETSTALESQSERLRAILETVIDGIVTIDDTGIIKTFNPAAEKIFGYSIDEVFNQNVKMLMPEPYQSEHDGYLDSYHKTGIPKVIGIGREVIGKRKDNSEFPMDLSISRMKVNGSTMFTGIVRDITERNEASDKIFKAMEEAKIANQTKTEFLSSMSHELRTPMNAILGFGQMLDFNPKEPLSATQKASVDQILKGGQHLLALINDILDLTQIEAGKADFTIEEIDPNKAVEECLTLIIGMSDSRGIEISTPDVISDAQNIKADYTRFKQVLLNLMSNAIKYNDDGGKVRISFGPTPENMLRINVTDTGIGIPDERQSELFKPFNRLGAENSEIEGTGIGLVVCKDLVELMGGTIGFESHIGIGSWFWFELPLAISQTVTSDAGGVIEGTEVRGQLEGISGTMLYVEDNPSNLKLMEVIVSNIDGLTMSSAHTAELGIDIAIANNPDIIILDINLPGMSGFDAIKELKKHETTKNTPIFALSAAATKADIKKGLEAGFEHYLTKPINVVEITDAVRKALETNR